MRLETIMRQKAASGVREFINPLCSPWRQREKDTDCEDVQQRVFTGYLNIKSSHRGFKKNTL
jgi:hypothetical protein